MEIVGVTNILGIFFLLAIRLELLHELLMFLLLLHIESVLALQLAPVNSSMLFPEIFEVDELLSFFLPVHDLLVDELSGRGLATLGDLLQAVELDHVLIAESFLFRHCIVSELLAFVSLLLQFAKVRHLDQKFMELISCEPIEYCRPLTLIKLFSLDAGFGKIL